MRLIGVLLSTAGMLAMVEPPRENHQPETAMRAGGQMAASEGECGPTGNAAQQNVVMA